MKLWPVEHLYHHFWVGATANPPKSDDKDVQLARVAFIINDFLHTTLQISMGWLYVVTSVIPLALKGILPIRIIPIGKIL